MALPHFIIAGAPKCGTTALWAFLSQHPDICMTSNKEPSFFSDDPGELEKPMSMMGSGDLHPGNYYRGLSWYESLFKHCQKTQVRGEATPRYFMGQNSASLIKSIVPQVKLIFLLRHPLEVMFSAYWQEHKPGLKLPDFVKMVTTNHPRFQFYCRIISYQSNLEKYYKHFSDKQILVLLHADLKQKPLETLQQIFEFIGVDKTFVPNNLEAQFNQRAIPRFRTLQRMLYSPMVVKLSKRMPVSLLPYLRPIRNAIRQLNLKERKNSSSIPSSIRQQLIQSFEKDIVYVEKLLGRDLNAWRT